MPGSRTTTLSGIDWAEAASRSPDWGSIMSGRGGGESTNQQFVVEDSHSAESVGVDEVVTRQRVHDYYDHQDLAPEAPTGVEGHRGRSRLLRELAQRNMINGFGLNPSPATRRDFSEQTDQGSSVSGNVEVHQGMTTTVARVFGQRASYPTIESHPLIVGQNLAGIEIELENVTINTPRFNYWEAKSDGSLRNSGMEFVCSAPWGGRDLYNAAIEIDSFLFNASPDESWRCSTHVHVDVRNMTAPQLKRMILAYIMYERILFKCSGWHRYKNNFCVALGFAQDQLAILARNWEKTDHDFLVGISQSWDKYTSLNLLPISNFGSVEFRISEAKWRKGKLIRLTNRFLSLKELAMSFEGSDSEFLEHLLTLPIHQAIRKGLPKSMPDYEEDLEIGFKLAHEVISMAKIRRRTIYTHVVQNSDVDTSRRFTMNIESSYREHLTSQLSRRSDGVWVLPETFPREITFDWLYQLQEKCRELGITFESHWFESTRLPSQHRQLYSEYRSARRNGIATQAPPVAPARSNSDFEIEDEDDDGGEGDSYISENW